MSIKYKIGTTIEIIKLRYAIMRIHRLDETQEKYITHPFHLISMFTLLYIYVYLSIHYVSL